VKAPVLVVADAATGRAIRPALEDDFDVTVTDSVTHAQALRSTGAFLVVFATREVSSELEAVELDTSLDANAVSAIARAAVAKAMAAQYAAARADGVGSLPHDDYVGLARYAMMRRYLLALIARHNGSVTDAARGAKLKRESLHRLMRRYHVHADEFRD
jgi:transcriptional regulator with GAF, ATPase, and Fis domain